MITKPTVFVLGAGASKPYGFPTGNELRTRICHELKRGNQLHAYVEAAEVANGDIEAMRLDFEQSGLASIDAFIAHRPQHQRACEVVIAASLLPLESQRSLTNVNGIPGNGDWYQYLWNLMRSNAQTPGELFGNMVRFITFNYDRSLERFLLNAIRGTFGVSNEESLEALAAFEIQHVYGDLGEWRTGPDWNYGIPDGENPLPRILEASKRIKTVPNVRPELDEVSFNWLCGADVVAFLGFGFDAMNCERIGLIRAYLDRRQNEDPQQFFSNSYGLSRYDQGSLELAAFGDVESPIEWIEGDGLALLRRIQLEFR